VTYGFGGAARSITCRRWRANTLAAARSPAQLPQLLGRRSICSSGSSMSIFVAPGAPRELPRLPEPEPGVDRRCRSRPSDDGGRDLFDDSIPNRRRNSATSAVNAAITTSCSAIRAACSMTSAARSSYDGRCGPEPDTRALCHTNPTGLIKGHHTRPAGRIVRRSTRTASPHNAMTSS
jgi:hypothetical protein